MKNMTMAQAMSAVIEKIDSMMNDEITRVYPLERIGNKENGYSYVLVGVDTMLAYGDKQIEYTDHLVSVFCNELTGFKPEITNIQTSHEIL